MKKKHYRLPIQAEQYKWWALGVTIIGGFMSILDTSIVNIAIPKMMAVFSVNADDAQWVLTAYMLTMGVVQPATGYLCDVYGTRRMYLLSLAVFVLGSALCGTAWSNDTMIAFRVLQAIGGGLIIPVTMSIVYQIFPEHERNMAMGIWGISAMVAPAIGPTLSGYFVEYWDWRLIFTINIPIGVVGYVMAMLVLEETPLAVSHRFDYGGLITSAVGLFCLLLALSKGVSEGWTSAYIITLIFLAATNLILFIFIELDHPEPLLDLSLFSDWNFSCSMFGIFLGTMALFGGIFMVPLYLESIMGYTAMQTGLLLFPSAATAGVMMPIAARLADRFGPKPIIVIGLTILMLGSLPLVYVDMDTNYQYVMMVMFVRGIGLGMSLMLITVMGMNTVPFSKISRASSLNNAIRQISGSLGIAILTTVMQNRQIFHLEHIASNMNHASQATRNIISYGEKMFLHRGDVAGIAHQKALALVSGIAQRQSYIFSFDDTFFVLFLICGIGVIPALLLKPVKNKKGPAVMLAE